MKRKIFNYIIALLSKLSGRKITYYKPGASSGFGRTAVKADAGFWYVGNVLDESDIAYGILNNGAAEPEGTELVVRILNYIMDSQASAIFYDIGANTGYYGILAAFLGSGKIQTYAFEPLLEYNGAERESISLNRLEAMCRVFNVAVSNQAGEAEIYMAGSGTTLHKEFLGSHNGLIRKINKVVLDSFAAEQNLPHPDFIKIDVEGAEFEVLDGSHKLVSDSLPVIWYEAAKDIKQLGYHNANYSRTAELLQQLGYKIYLQRKTSLILFQPDFEINGSSMYLALHPQKHLELISFLGL